MKYILIASWEVHIVKNCDRGLFKPVVTDRPQADK